MPYLRNIWYVAGHTEELDQGPIGRTYLDEPVVIYRTEGGQVVALDDRCPHRFASLHSGKVIGEAIQCPYHGLRFDGSGACVAAPSGDRPPPRARLRAYPVVDRHSLLWIWMGDAARADPALIPDYSDRDDPSTAWFTGVLHCRANYQLMVDNLLDLTHAEFLHPFLSSEGWSHRNKQTVKQEGDQITILNVAEQDNILPFARQLKPDMGTIGTTIHTERWDAPSLVRLSVDYYSGDEKLLTPSAHMLTPETERSTHYFIRGGQTIDPANFALTQGSREAVLAVFRTEDIPLIEAQQRNLGDGELMDHDPAVLVFDKGAIMVRRYLAKRIKQEQREAESALVAADQGEAALSRRREL
jgi:phenylpropionate dioxygenase-like ring-hydroxylating dioxygenase large terminal subunit